MKKENVQLTHKSSKSIARIKQPSTKLQRSAKIERDRDNLKSPWMEEYKDCFSLTFKPVTQAFIDRISEELVNWAKNDNNALRIADFYWSKGIPHKAYYGWKEKHEGLSIAHDAAMNFIASRREIGAITKKFDSGMISQSMPMYDPMWREFMEWKSKLKAQEGEHQSVKIEISDLSKKVEISE